MSRARWFAPILMISFAALPARADREIPIGPRAIAMGNAFTAVADDATSIFWNPAGLPNVGSQEIALTHADLFGSGIKNDVASFVLPFSSSWAAASDWFHTGFDDGELGYGNNRFDLATGMKVHRGVSLGLNFKYLSRSTQLDDVAISEGGGAGADAGVLLAPWDRLRLGATLQDIFNTRMNDRNGSGSSLVYGRSLRVGGAFRPLRQALVALDVDDRLHLGAEISPIALLSIRGGMEHDLDDTGESATYTTGLGLRAGILRFDYALSMHPTLGTTHHFGLQMDFNFNPSQVRIEKVETHDVFSSLGKTYASEPLGTVRARNLQNRPLTVQLGVYAPDLMDQPTEREIVLRPKATQDFPLTALLSEKVMGLEGDRRVPVNVTLRYTSERLPRSERRASQLVAYGPGAIRWSAGVEQAAAYVTSTDPVVADFARSACRSVAISEREPFPNRNVAFIAAIVDALDAMGVAYVPDPNNPYPSASESRDVIDEVQYPRQTLAQRTGDCDDTSVLLAALLENVGVPTRLVDVPGHLFLLAGAGLHERNRLALGVDESLYAIDGGQVWIPIETTAMGKGFAQAWKEGAEAYTSWASRGRVATIDVERAQARYEPADLPQPSPSSVAPIDSAALTSRVAKDASVVGAWRNEFRSSRLAAARGHLDISPAALGEIAHVYFAAGELEDARASLQRAISMDGHSAMIRNNLANIEVAQHDYPGACDGYRVAISADSLDAGIWLNLGLVLEASGDTTGAAGPLERGIDLSGGYQAACDLLGIASEESPRREGAARMSEAEARELLLAALGRVPAESDSTERKSPPATTSKPRTRVAAARSSSGADLALHDLLYWKE